MFLMKQAIKVWLWQRHSRSRKHISVQVAVKDLPLNMAFCNIIAGIRTAAAHSAHTYANVAKHFSKRTTWCYISANTWKQSHRWPLYNNSKHSNRFVHSFANSFDHVIADAICGWIWIRPFDWNQVVVEIPQDAQNQLQTQQQAQAQTQQNQAQQNSQQQQQQLTTREVLIGNQPVHVQVLQGNTAQVIKYEINIPQDSQQIEWTHLPCRSEK